MFGKYVSPLGYQTDKNEIDSYGVNHKDFSLRDELEYQNARVNREQNLIEKYNNQGIAKNYPQYATNFWGTNADNNYGFGKSDIHSNIDNVIAQSRPSQTTETHHQHSKQLSATYFLQKIKDGIAIATDTINYTPEALGELAADTLIAKEYYDKMNATGKQLVNTYGAGGGRDIDNYYHPLLQCELSKISPTSRDWGLRLGYAKEVWDYHKKKGKYSLSEIATDNQKDLQNNIYGSNLAINNPNRNCRELLDDKRTPNMRKKNIW